MHGKKILIIDDDPKLRRLMEYPIQSAGAEVISANDGKEGLRKFFSERPDLVILDLMMPNMDGWETCESIRQLSDVPIIMVTAKGHDEDIIAGLDAGADDYITKPFSPKVLVARVRAALRRLEQTPVQSTSASYSDDYLRINLDSHQVFVEGNEVKLTATEFKLLTYLLENSGRVVNFEQILKNVWGWDYDNDVNYVRVYIWHLRQKIEKDQKNPQYILNVQGIGYRFQTWG